MRKFLVIAAALAMFASAPVLAQDPAFGEANAPAPAVPTGAAGQDLPFINDGANQPVLQTISPDGVAYAPDAMEAPEAAGHEGAEGHKKGLPQFDPSTYSKQLFWLALTFAFLFFFYSKITLPRIASVVDGRANKVERDLEEAQALKNEVQAIRTAYEAAIAAAQTEAQKLVTNVQNDIKRMAETQDAAFKANAESAMNAIENKVKINRTRVEGELSSLAAGLAVDIAARVAGVKSDAQTAQGIVDGLSQQAKAA